MPRVQVDRSEPGSFTLFQKDPLAVEQYMEVDPKWARTDAHSRVANICRLEDLYVSNRQRLYGAICKKIVSTSMEFSTVSRKLPFMVQRIAGDGRCGFRCLDEIHTGSHCNNTYAGPKNHLAVLDSSSAVARSILAAQNLDGFRSIARRGLFCQFRAQIHVLRLLRTL